LRAAAPTRAQHRNPFVSIAHRSSAFEPRIRSPNRPARLVNTQKKLLQLEFEDPIQGATRVGWAFELYYYGLAVDVDEPSASDEG
jgi:hypothetical protein